MKIRNSDKDLGCRFKAAQASHDGWPQAQNAKCQFFFLRLNNNRSTIDVVRNVPYQPLDELLLFKPRQIY